MLTPSKHLIPSLVFPEVNIFPHSLFCISPRTNEIDNCLLCIWKQEYNKGYETNPSAYGPVINCHRKQGHYSDGKICEMMTLNEIFFIL
jgi:hypothetical protein